MSTVNKAQSDREELKSEYGRDDLDLDPDDEMGLSSGASCCCVV